MRAVLAKYLLLVLSLVCVSVADAGMCRDGSADSLQNVLWGNAKVNFEARYRYEYVAEQTLLDSRASTLRPRFSYETGAWHKLSLGTQLDGAFTVGPTNYNDGLDAHSSRAVIPDAPYFEPNELWLAWQADNWLLRYGRQAINLDDQRFVGSDAFWQNEQTFDGFTARFDHANQWHVMYAYLNNLNRNLPPDEIGANLDMQTHLLNIRYEVTPDITFATYDYQMDFDSPLSNNTFGMRVSLRRIAELPLHFEWEYADQSSVAGEPDYNAYYRRVMGGFTWAGMRFTTGVEIMDGDLNAELQTPLASLHDHSGWADRFMRGNKGWGLKDQPITMETTLPGELELLIQYHAYTSVVKDPLWGQLNYGDEHGLTFRKKLSARWQGEFSYFRFRPEDGSYGFDEARRNVKKYWLMLTYRFN